MNSLWGRREQDARSMCMRFAVRLFWAVSAIALIALSTAGCRNTGLGYCSQAGAPDDCEVLIEDLPPGTLTCDTSPAVESPLGTCVPYVDAGWHTVLARMAFLPKHLLTCPESAPNAGLYGVEIPETGAMPRRVVGCSVNPYSSCPSPGLTCVPFELDYAACITQSGPHDCPDDYPQRTSVEEDGLGAEATICCRPPPQPE